jgi:hypothetical protein
MRKIVSACLKLVLAAGFAITMGLSASSPATAFTGDQWQHILDCAGWMFSDPARHAAECGPGHLGDITSDSRGWGFSAPNPPAPPKVTCPVFASSPAGLADPSAMLIQAVCDDSGCSEESSAEIPCEAFRSEEFASPALDI